MQWNWVGPYRVWAGSSAPVAGYLRIPVLLTIGSSKMNMSGACRLKAVIRRCRNVDVRATIEHHYLKLSTSTETKASTACNVHALTLVQKAQDHL
jgi:hypothetical protein